MALGIIGGTGFGEDILGQEKRHRLSSPYGKPSGEIVEGKISGTKAFFIMRHGKGHAINPSMVNYRANIHALKGLGATMVIGVHAVGSLREDYMPGDMVFVDQFIDRTTQRAQTFFDRGRVLHISLAEPYCPSLRSQLVTLAKVKSLPHKASGTVVVIEGPRFSTRAESRLFRSWGADIVSMTALPECILAREIGLHYASIALVTDYDCWKDTSVDMEMISRTVSRNASKVKLLIREGAKSLAPKGCDCEIACERGFA